MNKEGDFDNFPDKQCEWYLLWSSIASTKFYVWFGQYTGMETMNLVF